MKEKKLVSQYHNDINNVAFSSFNSNDFDLFFSICLLMRDKGLKTLKLNFDNIKLLANIKGNYTTNDFALLLDSMYKKLLQLNFVKISGTKTTRFVLFKEYTIDTSEKTILIRLNSDYQYLLNNLTGNFTLLKFKNFLDFKSNYSKTAYRLLSQKRTLKKLKIEIKEFRRLFDIPESYRMSDIDKSVLKPVYKELKPIYKNFQIAKAKTGKRVTAIQFSFEEYEEIAESSHLKIKKETEKITPMFDDRTFEEIQEEQKNKAQKEFETLNPSERAKKVREQIKNKL